MHFAKEATEKEFKLKKNDPIFQNIYFFKNIFLF